MRVAVKKQTRAPLVRTLDTPEERARIQIREDRKKKAAEQRRLALRAAEPLEVIGLDAMSEEALAVLAARDNRQAFDVLFRKVWAFALETACCYGRRSGWSEDEAADAAQEAMLRAWRYRVRYRASTPYRTWLRAIVTNRVITAQGRKVSAPEGPEKTEAALTGSPDAELCMGTPGEDPAIYTERRETETHARGLLAALSEDDQYVLACWAEGRTDDISAGATSQAIRVRVHRAKDRLRTVARAAGGASGEDWTGEAGNARRSRRGPPLSSQLYLDWSSPPAAEWPEVVQLALY